jgi:hypothetical protein
MTAHRRLFVFSGIPASGRPANLLKPTSGTSSNDSRAASGPWSSGLTCAESDPHPRSKKESRIKRRMFGGPMWSAVFELLRSPVGPHLILDFGGNAKGGRILTFSWASRPVEVGAVLSDSPGIGA